MCREMRAFNGPEPELMHDERNKFVRAISCLGPHESEGVTE